MSKDKKSSYYDAGGIETFDIIKAKLSPEEYKGYLKGTAIGYVCRMGFKGCEERDSEKLSNYSKWLEEYLKEYKSFNPEPLSASNFMPPGDYFPTEKDIENSMHAPRIVRIDVSGPVSSGKSIVLDRINKMLKNEFGAEVVSLCLKEERNANDYDADLVSWQKEMIRGTVWHLSEKPETEN